MKKYIKEHEIYIKENINNDDLKSLYDYHLRQISWLQHERLIHLMVLMLTTVVMITNIVLIFIVDIMLLYFLGGIFIVLEVFYLLHYFLLENTVQRWYKYANHMNYEIYGIGKKLYEGE